MSISKKKNYHAKPSTDKCIPFVTWMNINYTIRYHFITFEVNKSDFNCIDYNMVSIQNQMQLLSLIIFFYKEFLLYMIVK